MASLNKVMLIGNLGKDPEIRKTQSGKPIAKFSIATSESCKDKQTGEKKEKTEWHNIVVFNEGLAGVVERYVKKGSKIYIEGQLQTRKWQDKDGNDRYSTEIVLQSYNGQLIMLDGRNASADTHNDTGTNYNALVSKKQDYAQEIDDDVPF
jgi:single-strand DNA-binding protein